MRFITSGNDLYDIITEQYHLASKANISIYESNQLACFEREIFLDLLHKDLKEQNASLSFK